MSENSTGCLERIRDSNRAMIPLAVIAVLLLVSSVLLVGYLETRPEPEPNVDVERALDQTEATTQAVVRDSSLRGTELAATQPLTEPADTEWGAVLNESGAGLASDPFENYLRALIYLEVKKDLPLASKERGAVETTVTVPEISNSTSFSAAINRVTLEDRETELAVSLSNVTITATHDGAVVAERETTIEVTVVTPVMQLHDRVSAYQYAIDEAPLHERGFTQRFNARTYAIGWARGWAQNYRAPVGEVLANRHIEPSANAALYRTQQDIFGAADPALRNSVRLGWTCMGLKDGEAMFDEYMADRDGISYSALEYDDETRELAYNDSYRAEIPEDVTGGLCSGAHLLVDQVTEQHPPSPSAMELIGGTDRLQENETVDIGETASLPLIEMADPDFQYSFENAIQRIFTINGTVDATTNTDDEDFDIDLSCDSRYRSGDVSRNASRSVQTTDRTVLDDVAERYYEYESEVRVHVAAERPCYTQDGNESTTERDSASYSIELTTVVREEEGSPFAKIDGVNPESDIHHAYRYNPGPHDWGHTQFNNYDGAEKQVTTALTGGTSKGSHEQWLDDRLSGTNYEEDPPNREIFETTRTVELDYDRLLDDFQLKAAMADDIVSLQETTAAVEAEFERSELATGNPMEYLLENLEETVKAEYIDESSSHTYENVGEKALYEARYMYYLTVVERLTELADAHDSATGELDDRISDVDDSLGNATQYLEQGIQEDDPEPESLLSSDLTQNVSYAVSGSPTYLLSEETVETDRVPPVDSETEFASLRAKNTNTIDMPYDEVVNEILEFVLGIVPGVSATPDAEITLRMAGDVLSAGELAVDAQADADRADRNDTYLDDGQRFEADVERFEKNVAKALDAFEENVTKQIVTGLYPSPATECLIYDRSLSDDRYPGWESCSEVSEEQAELDDLVHSATEAVRTGVETALEPYDTAETALLIGEGNATGYLVENVTRELDDAAFYQYNEFDEEYNDEQWREFVASAVHPAVLSASARSVEIGSVDQAEQLDMDIQNALGNATDDLVEDRVEHVSEMIGETVGERWLGNTQGSANRAARVPAGLPLLPIPGKWVATANAWDVEVAGEYARFEVSANMATPAQTTELTYVRENLTVTRDIAGEERTLGSVEPISFDSRTILLVVTPPGVGVGDRDSTNPECSATYPDVGPVDAEEERTCSHPAVDGDENGGDENADSDTFS